MSLSLDEAATATEGGEPEAADAMKELGPPATAPAEDSVEPEAEVDDFGSYRADSHRSRHGYAGRGTGSALGGRRAQRSRAAREAAYMDSGRGTRASRGQLSSAQKMAGQASRSRVTT